MRPLHPLAFALFRAADLIEEKGWWSSSHRAHGGICIEDALYAGKHAQAALDAFCDYIGDDAAAWNDDQTSQEVVVATMRAAATAMASR